MLSCKCDVSVSLFGLVFIIKLKVSWSLCCSYQSHEAMQNAVPNDQHTSLGYGYNQLPSQAETGIQQGNAAEYYSLYQVPRVQHVSSPIQTHLNNIGSTCASSRDSSSLNSAPTY